MHSKGNTQTSAFRERWNAHFSKPKHNRALRFVIFVMAIFCISFSIALARTAQLGTSPIAAIPNVMSYALPVLTIGQYQILMNLLMASTEVVLNKSFRRPVELLQMIPACVFGMLVDLNVWLLQGLPVESYAMAWGWCVLSIVILGLGVSIELLSDFMTLPGEGIVVSIAMVSQKPFSRCKVGFDLSCVVVAALISLVVFSGLVGVREGTVATALFTGFAVKCWSKLTNRLRVWIPAKPEKQ